ncbi:MAG: hypothetical protein AAF211_10715, partial [Myxococcota bacterium]
EAVLARVPEVGDGVPPIRARRGWRWGVGGLVGLSTLTAFWLGTQFGGLDLETPADPVTPPAEAPTPVEPDTPAAATPAIEKAAAPTPPASAPPVAPPVIRRAPVAPDPASAPIPSVSDAPIPEPVSTPDASDGVAGLTAPPPPRSQLGAEIAVYDAAVRALAAGEATRAADGFRQYLDQFPGGTLRPDAELKLLWALRDSGDAARIERWAAVLVERPEHASQHADIRELRAQALVRLGRCEEALESIDGMPSRIVGPVRRACRRR